MNVKVYSKVNCFPCKLTKRWLSEHNVNYDYEEFDPKEEADYAVVRERLMEYGFMSFPVVTVTDDDNNVVNKWAGFAPNKLKSLIK